MSEPVENLKSVVQIRPRFEIELPYDRTVLHKKISESLKAENSGVKGNVYEEFASLTVPESEQHYWSPRLILSIEENQRGSLLKGLYGPRPSVWTMFIFFYALIAFAILVVGIIGMSNLSLDKSAQILWLVPALVIAFLSLYLVAFFGQKLGHDQMVTLHDFLEEALDVEI